MLHNTLFNSRKLIDIISKLRHHWTICWQI